MPDPDARPAIAAALVGLVGWLVPIGLRAWFLRRDPGLLAVRRAVRVAAVACLGFYVCYYLLDNPVMATYALFAAVAMGFLSQIPGPAVRRSVTLLASLPVALLLVTVGTLLAGNLWAATAGILAFGFLISYAGVGGPRLVGLSAGMQLFFILACFPPYAPDTLTSRLVGVCIGLGLLALVERTLWPDRASVSYQAQLANACERLADHLTIRATGDPDASAATLAAVAWPPEAAWPSHLPAEARPASPGRRDRALSDAGSVLSYALARLREMPSGTAAPLAVAGLLDRAARTATATTQALRGAWAPDTEELAAAISAVQTNRRERPGLEDPDRTRMTTLSVATADGVWNMATAIRVVLGAPIESGHGARRVRQDRFPYAYASSVRLWWQQFAAHLMPRSVYFQGAVRVAVALAAARLIAGMLELSHGFWVLLATLTLLRSRAVDTRIAIRPAVVGTVAGAAAAGVLLVVVGARPDIYAAITPPIMVVAFAAGALLGPAWGQALFTVVVTLIFTQLAPAGAAVAGVRVVDVFVGIAVGVAAGVLAWPRGAGGELRRSAARFLAAGGEAVRETAQVLATSRSLSPPTDASRDAMPRVTEAMVLADAAYGMYQTERHESPESTVDWQAVMTAGHHIVRGSQLLRDIFDPGSLAQWRPLVDDSATRVHDACAVVANALYEGRDPRVLPPAFVPTPGSLASDTLVVDVQTWLAGVSDDLKRLSADAKKHWDGS